LGHLGAQVFDELNQHAQIPEHMTKMFAGAYQSMEDKAKENEGKFTRDELLALFPELDKEVFEVRGRGKASD